MSTTRRALFCSLTSVLTEVAVKAVNLENADDGAAVGRAKAPRLRPDAVGCGGVFIERSDMAPIGNDAETFRYAAGDAIGRWKPADCSGVNAGNDDEIAAANCEVSSVCW